MKHCGIFYSCFNEVFIMFCKYWLWFKGTDFYCKLDFHEILSIRTAVEHVAFVSFAVVLICSLFLLVGAEMEANS